MTDNRTTELLPCPFCSSEPDLLESYGGWYIRCSCGVSMCENYSEGGFPVGEFVTEAEAIAAWNTRATHGTLTAEKVRETVEKHWHDLPNEYDMPEATALPEYSYNWQAIADELNAELGSGECELIYSETDEGMDSWFTQCGGRLAATFENGRMVHPKFCQLCGGKAVKR